jgi:hypothetical protein
VVVVDVEDVGVLALYHLGGVAVDVAAIQEDDRALGDVVGDGRAQPVEIEEAVLVGQGELALAHQHHGVLAERRQDALHGDERAERVAVDVLVRHEQEALGLAQLVENLGALVHADRAHSPTSRRTISSSRAARSAVSSSTNSSAGVFFIRSSAATRRCRNPCAEVSPSTDEAFVASSPRTLT